MTLLSDLIQINEVTEPVDPTLDLEDQLNILEQRMAAAKRGLGFANKLKNPVQKKKHIALVLTNLNKIRGSLTKVIAQMDQFSKAERDHETSLPDHHLDGDYFGNNPEEEDQHRRYR